jgi:hypothetical protein
MSVQLVISPRRFARILSFAALGLTLASVAGSLSVFCLSPSEGLLKQVQKSFVRIFYLDLEANVPTWYSASMLLFCAALLAMITCAKRAQQDPYARHWAAMAVVFLGLSIDETAILHEMAIRPLRLAFHADGLLYYAWVVPGAAFVLLFALAYLRFWWRLPPRTRALFCIAGAVYVGGAIGAEAFSGLRAARYDEGDFGYMMIATLEELMEMTGLVVFIYALLDYMGRHIGEVALRFSAVKPRAASKRPPKPAAAPVSMSLKLG